MNKEEFESPYCEVCGTCGCIGCCGIRNFISEHIEGKTNCKNESWIISDLINLCDYKDSVFEENKQLKEQLEKAIEKVKDISFKFTTDKFWYSVVLSTTEDGRELLEILEGNQNDK